MSVEHDERWLHALDGLRCRITYKRRGAVTGEITGLRPSFLAEGEPRVFVVFDGEEDPVLVAWPDVRPLVAAFGVRSDTETGGN